MLILAYFAVRTVARMACESLQQWKTKDHAARASRERWEQLIHVDREQRPRCCSSIRGSDLGWIGHLEDHELDRHKRRSSDA